MRRGLSDGERDILAEAERDARETEEALAADLAEWADVIEGCAIEAMIAASLALLPDDGDDDLPPW